MIKRGLLKKVAVFSLAACMSFTIIGGTTAFAADKKANVENSKVANKKDVKNDKDGVCYLKTTIKSLKIAEGYSKSDYNDKAIKELEANLKESVGEINAVVETKGNTKTATVKVLVKQFQFDGAKASVTSIENILTNKGKVLYKEQKKKDGSTVFSGEYDLTKEERTKDFIVTIEKEVSASGDAAKKEVSASGDAAKEDGNMFRVQVELNDIQNVSDENPNHGNDTKTDNKGANDAKKDNQVTQKSNTNNAKSQPQTTTKSTVSSSTKTPKTSDEMSTSVMASILVGGLSVASMLAIYISKRRKNNI